MVHSGGRKTSIREPNFIRPIRSPGRQPLARCRCGSRSGGRARRRSAGTRRCGRRRAATARCARSGARTPCGRRPGSCPSGRSSRRPRPRYGERLTCTSTTERNTLTCCQSPSGATPGCGSPATITTPSAGESDVVGPAAAWCRSGGRGRGRTAPCRPTAPGTATPRAAGQRRPAARPAAARTAAGARGPVMKGHPARSMRMVAERYRPPPAQSGRAGQPGAEARSGSAPCSVLAAARRARRTSRGRPSWRRRAGRRRSRAAPRRRARARPRAGAGPRCRPAPAATSRLTALRSCMPSVSSTIRSPGSRGNACTSKALPGTTPNGGSIAQLDLLHPAVRAAAAGSGWPALTIDGRARCAGRRASADR